MFLLPVAGEALAREMTCACLSCLWLCEATGGPWWETESGLGEPMVGHSSRDLTSYPITDHMLLHIPIRIWLPKPKAFKGLGTHTALQYGVWPLGCSGLDPKRHSTKQGN